MFGLNRVDRLIIELARDNVSGASDMVSKAVAVFLAFAQDFDGPMKRYFPELVNVGKKIITAQPSMAPIFNCVNDLLCTLEGVAKKSLMSEFTQNWAEAYLKELERAREWVIQNGSAIIEPGDTIMTYSHSSAVLGLLGRCKDRMIHVIVSEGRPINEGIIHAEALGKEGIRSTLVVDAALSSYMKKVKKVIVGADAITESGVVNKIGTRALALAAHWEKVPFFVAAEKNKFVMSGFFTPSIAEQSPIEITLRKMRNVEVKNLYFDETPFDLVTGIITEDGIKTPEETMQFLKGRNICNELLIEEIDIDRGLMARD